MKGGENMRSKKVRCSCGEIFETRARRMEHAMLLAGYHQLTSPEHYLVDDNNILTEEKWKKIANETKKEVK